ncbi:MAG: hypothetical protein ACPLKZ_01130 [Candidatus Bathyarchaeales archaeon]
MKSKAEKGFFAKITLIAFILWLFLVPFFWRFDVAQGTYGFYDLFFISNYSVLHLIVFYVLGAISISFNRHSLWPLLLFAMYFPLIQLVNYPYLTMRDTYLHAAPTKSLLSNGNLINYKDAEVSSWPGSFYIHGIMTIICGCDLVTANYILYFALVAVVAVIAYLFGRLLQQQSFNLVWLAPFLFLSLFFNHLFDNFHHYSRTSLAFTLLFIFFFLFFRMESHRGLFLKFLLVCSVIITHPFQSLVLVAFLLVYIAFNFRVKIFTFAFFSLVGFVGWMLFQGSSTLSEAIGRLPSFFSSEYIQPIIETLPTKETLPWIGGLLREYFRYSFLGLFGCVVIASVILILFKRDKMNPIIFGLLSFLFSSIVMLSCLLLLPDWHVARFTPFAAFPLAFSFFVLFEKLIYKKPVGEFIQLRRILSPKITAILALSFVVSLSATVMVLRFERNFYFGEMYHPSEMSSLSFFFNHSENSTVTVVSWRTCIYSIYFNENFAHKLQRVWYLDLKEFGSNASKVIFAYTQLISQSNVVIRGLRDNYTLGGQLFGDCVLQVIDDELSLRTFCVFYSNGYYFVHERMDSVS